MADPIAQALALLRKARPEQMKRAREAGFDTTKMFLHGTQTSPTEINPNFYVSRQPEIADVYARRGEHLLPHGEIPEGAAVMPVFVKKGEARKTNPMAGYSVVENPTSVRSIWAEFDPTNKDSANIMGSMAGAGALGAGATTMPEDAQNYAHGGHIDAALHAVRRHFDEGGFLDKVRGMFSGDDYQSTGDKVVKDGEVQWGNPDSAADFFRADKARMALAKAVADEPLPPRRPVAPDLPAPRAAPDVRPMAYAPATGAAQASALQAINATTSPLDIRDISHLSEYRGAAMENPQAVVFHHTAGEGTPEGVVNTLNTRKDPFTGRPMTLGAHYIIDRDGSIHSALPPGTRGAHIMPSKINDLTNANTYGVEVIAKDNSDVTPAQIAAGQRLYAHLSAGRSEPLGVFGHGELNPGHKLPDEGLAIVNPIRTAAAPVSATDAAVDTARKVTNRAVNYPELSADDKDLIAKTIAAEASGKSPEEAHAIANAILNRAIAGGRYGKSIRDILFAENQFEPWSDESKENYPMKFKPGMPAYDAGAAALQKAYDAGDITGGSTYFWAPKAQGALGRDVPGFARKYPGFNIGATRFHRETRDAGGEVEGYAGGGDVVKQALNAIRGWHGSGKQFKQFDASKMGSGVGELFGRGVYVTDTPDFARTYRDMGVRAKPDQKIGGRPASELYDLLQKQADSLPPEQAQPVYNKIKILEDLMFKGDPLAVRDVAKYGIYDPEAMNWFEGQVVPKLKTPGGLYEVEIKAKPEQFLQWQKPFGEQSPFIQDALRPNAVEMADKANQARAQMLERGIDYRRRSFTPERIEELRKISTPEEIGGLNLYGAIHRDYGSVNPHEWQPEANQFLRDKGVVGNAYRDKGGQGDIQNYVVYDPADTEILNRYAHGGGVDDALRVVREHHADGNAVGQPDSNQYLADMQKFAQQNMHTLSADPERDRRALAAMMYGEMRGRPESLYAAQAAMNRSLAQGIPVADVVTAPKQFKGYSPQSLQAVTNPAGVKNSIERAAAIAAMQRATEALTGKAQGTIGPGTPFANITSFNQAPPAQNYAKWGAVPGTAVVGKTINPGDPHTYYTVKDLAGPLAKAQAKAAAAIAQAAPQQTYGPQPATAPQQTYGPQPATAPQQTYGPQPAAAPQQTYGPQPAAAPQAESQPGQSGGNDVTSTPPDTGTQPSFGGFDFSAPSFATADTVAAEASQPSSQNDTPAGAPAGGEVSGSTQSSDTTPGSSQSDSTPGNASSATTGDVSNDTSPGTASLSASDPSTGESFGSTTGTLGDNTTSDTSDSSSSDGGGQGDGNGGVGEKRGGYIHGHHIVDRAMRVVREHHADGEAVGMNQRMRDTIASIDPERSQDQPVMDPAIMGAAWQNSLRNFQNFPRQEGEAVARPLELGARDVIGGAIAGEARAPGADFRRGVADLLVGSKGLPDSGTLGFGLADAPMLTGVPLTLADMARDIGRGDYASTAMGAGLPAAFYARGPLGAAGRRAVEIAREYAKPAAATATGVAANIVTPEDAEAAKLSKALNIIRTAERPAESRFISQAGEHGYFQPQSARERDPRLWHPISNTVLSRPLGEMTAEHRLLSGLPERKFIRPEDLEGASMIPALGDRTIGDSLLTGVNGVKFKDPVSMQAGHSFMYGPASKGPDRAVWASDPGVITVLSNKARAASEAGFDPYLNYVAMSSRSGDYSHHMADTLRQMLPQAKVPKDVIAEFDRQMRENTANKWAAYGDWPGLKSKKLEEYLYSTGPGKARTKMAELMGQGQFQKAGMPDVGAARFAITDPELLHAVDYSAGRSIARLDPMGRKITDPAVPHKTYLHQLAAHPEEGYVGGFEHDIPFEVLNKEWIDQIRARDPAAAENPSQLAYTYRLSAPRVDFKPQVVDRLSKFLEMKKAGLIP